MLKKLFKVFALLLTFTSILILLFEGMTGVLSSILCQKLCRESYASLIEPKIVDLSCGFNVDRYLGFSLVLMLVIGILLNVLSSRVSVSQKKDEEIII